MDLFSANEADRVQSPGPLADRMRPRSLEELLGQDDVIGAGRPLRLAIEHDTLTSVILWGPPGSG
jgi:putative ATPase